MTARKHWEKRGQLWAAPSSWIPWQEAMDYACAPPGRKTRLKRTISNTLTVPSGRFLTASSIRWSRLYMTAHSYAVTFHCILINTWLNQARTTLLITQDKKTRQSWWPRRDPEEKFFDPKDRRPWRSRPLHSILHILTGPKSKVSRNLLKQILH